MVSTRARAPKLGGTLIRDEPSRASKNPKDFKIFTGSARAKAGSCEPNADSVASRGAAGKAPEAASRKLVAVGTFANSSVQTNLNGGKGKAQSIGTMIGKFGNSVKMRTGRKALADVSNLNNDRSNQLQNRPSNNKKDKVEGSNLSHSNIVSGKNHCRPRISLSKSAVVANASSSKPAKENLKNSVDVTVKVNAPVESNIRRKTLSEIRSYKERHRNLSRDNSKPVINPGVKLLRPSRLSLATQKAMDGNTSSGKTCILVTRVGSVRTNSRVTCSSKIKHTFNTRTSVTVKPSNNNEVEEGSQSDCVNNPSDVSQVCGAERIQSDASCCSNDNVAVLISRPKRNRRKSYTLSLVSKYELMEGSVDIKKKDELPNIDDSSNPLEVVEYVDDIYQYYWTMELHSPLLEDYMVLQSDITPRMRGILINWLIEVHLKFQLMQETLFLMVELLDRVLSILVIKKNEFQMVGLTALLLASKYEDFWHPKIDELISISANLYTRDQMLAMEKRILKILKFRLNVPTPYVFMLRFLKAAQADKKLEHLAFYLIELCLVEYEALKYRPSLLCASAIYLARCTLKMTPAWTGLLRKHARYGESQLRSCAAMILRFQRAACLKPTKITYEKFLNADLNCVASIEPLDTLPL